MHKVVILITFILLSVNLNAQVPFPADAGKQPTANEIFSVKETFKYEVKYGFFKLGWVEVTLEQDTLVDGRLMKHLVTEIRSNSRVPFVGKELDRFHSFFFLNEDGIPVTSYYWKDNVDEEKFKEIEYTFDRELNEVRYKEEDDSRDTLRLIEPATAGHVIFIFSRLFAGGGETSRLPVYVTKKLGYINMENGTEIEMRKYAPFEGKVATFLSRGTTEEIEGPFGFSGNFRAWYLADDLRVPLEARVRVLFGNAIVRLIEYEREER